MRAFLVLIALLVLAAPARAADQYIDDGDAQKELDAAKQRWAQGGLTDYGFTVQYSCFCPEEYTKAYTVHVRDGEPVHAAEQTRGHNTVPKLFGLVQAAIDDRADRLDVSYRESGAPRELYVDRSQQIADEEFGVTASDPVAETGGLDRTVDDSIADGSAASALADARRRWRDRGLRTYRFRLALGCFCPAEIRKSRRMVVRRGKAVAPPKHLRAYATVPKLYATVAKAIDDRVSGLEVKYGEDGLPRTIAIDPDNRAADEERYLTASRLRG